MRLQHAPFFRAEVAFTSSTSQPVFSTRDDARQSSNWSTYGYMHAEVFPVPTAPRIMTPVCRPRRGIFSHVGAATRDGDVGWCCSRSTRNGSARVEGFG